MTTTTASGEALAAAAVGLVGCRFRLHGRDPLTGLDCVGLVGAALAAMGRRVALPTGYALRSHLPPALDAIAAACGLVSAAADDAARPGDVLLLRPAPCQHHLAIAGEGGAIVHAHAGLRRVVLMPGPPAWPELRRWRLT